MKKILPLAISLTIFAGQTLNATTAMAIITDDMGGKYWSIAEVIEYERETDAAMAESCASSPAFNECMENKRVRYIINEGDGYEPVLQLKNRRFTITSVNPTRSTLRVHYTGFNSRYKYKKAHIAELYMYWLEDGKITPQLDWTTASLYTDKIRNNQIEDGMHVIFARNEPQTEGSEWLKNGEEVRIVLPTGSLIGDTNRQIYYTMVNDVGDTYSGFQDYIACASSDEFGDGEGMECQGTYYINRSHTYFLKAAAESEDDKGLPFSSFNLASDSSDTEPEIPPVIEDDYPIIDDIPITDDLPVIDNPPVTDNLPTTDDPLTVEDHPVAYVSPATEEPPITDVPPATEEPLITNAPPATEESQQVAEEPLATEEPLTTDEPQTTKESSATKELLTTQISLTTDKPLNITPISIKKNETTLVNMPKTPNTGEYIEEGNSTDPSSQRLITTLIILSLLFIVWWIIPANKKKKQ